MAALVPGATLHVLEGNEHEPFIRDSGNVVEAILDFVEGRSLAREQVLTLLAEGQPNKLIAQRLPAPG